MPVAEVIAADLEPSIDELGPALRFMRLVVRNSASVQVGARQVTAHIKERVQQVAADPHEAIAVHSGPGDVN